PGQAIEQFSAGSDVCSWPTSARRGRTPDFQIPAVGGKRDQTTLLLPVARGRVRPKGDVRGTTFVVAPQSATTPTSQLRHRLREDHCGWMPALFTTFLHLITSA